MLFTCLRAVGRPEEIGRPHRPIVLILDVDRDEQVAVRFVPRLHREQRVQRDPAPVRSGDRDAAADLLALLAGIVCIFCEKKKISPLQYKTSL